MPAIRNEQANTLESMAWKNPIPKFAQATTAWLLVDAFRIASKARSYNDFKSSCSPNLAVSTEK